MPIRSELEITAVNEERFREIDSIVTGLAFKIQNKYGNQLSEEVYKCEIQYALQKSGMMAVLETGFIVEFPGFSRRYPCDLVVENSVIYETKAVAKINESHKNQLLHYLFLAGIFYGKILNFRPAKVESWYVSTSMSTEQRKGVPFYAEDWIEPQTSVPLKDTLEKIVRDVGVGLYKNLYLDALRYLLGPENLCERTVEILDGNRKVGEMIRLMLKGNSLLVLTTFTKPLHHYEINLQRFLQHSSLQSIHWINLSIHEVTLKTLT